MRHFCELWAIGLSTIVIMASSVSAQSMIGKVSVTSGSQFQMQGGNVSIHLFGVETCAMDGIAHYQDVGWRCGVVSAGWLTQLTLGYEINCLEEGSDGYAAIYGRCFLPSGEDIAKLALELGMAMAARKEGAPIERSYGVLEDVARQKRAGIWSSSFVHGGVLYRAGNL